MQTKCQVSLNWVETHHITCAGTRCKDVGRWQYGWVENDNGTAEAVGVRSWLFASLGKNSITSFENVLILIIWKKRSNPWTFPMLCILVLLKSTCDGAFRPVYYGWCARTSQRWWKANTMADVPAGKVALPDLTTAQTAKRQKQKQDSQLSQRAGQSNRAETGRGSGVATFGTSCLIPVSILCPSQLHPCCFFVFFLYMLPRCPTQEGWNRWSCCQ